MRRLRARHWLAVTLAASLIVVASSTETTNLEGPAFEVVAGSPDGRGVARAGKTSVGPDGPLAPDATEDGQGLDGTNNPDDGAIINPQGEPVDQARAQDSVGPVGPFTGLPVEPGIETRPALIIKIDNHPRARPQTGLDQADIVFDLRAEVVNRFFAVFQSATPSPAGPVRSSRTSDFDLLRGFDTPIYASSGANDVVREGLASLPIVALTADTRSEYYRDQSRSAPHNLYVDGAVLRDIAPNDLPAPQPWFTYRAAGEGVSPEAIPVVGPVAIDFTGNAQVTHEWDPGRGGWRRTQNGEPHLTSAGEQLAPENVVIMVTDYSVSAADAISPEVRSTGGGDVVVLTDGHAVLGRWERPSAQDKPRLLDRSGNAISLTPGRTWVLFPEPDQVTLPDGRMVAAGQTTTEAENRSVPAQNSGCAAVSDPGNCWPRTATTDLD